MDADFEYVVVGSGAGGGPLAANLARAGRKVLLLEAGASPDGLDYQVPAFHALATEDPDMRWDFFVRHYDDDGRQARDSKFVADRGGVLYPRAGTLGGCTAHNAMITVYPHNHDWDELAALTGDPSWSSERMRGYFERLERCLYETQHRPPSSGLLQALARLVPWLRDRYGNLGRHGFDGWLCTSLADPWLAVRDEQLVRVILSAAEQALSEHLGRELVGLQRLWTYPDPNDWRVQRDGTEGLWLVPVAVRDGRRSSVRDRLQAVVRDHPGNLTIRTGALATRVLLEDGRAVGVEFLDGAHLYRADPRAPAGGPLPRAERAAASREVVLAGGAFNTPQLLKLSGIGPRDELAALGIDVAIDLSGVGENLQDRYEVGVISEVERDFALLKGCGFGAPGTDADDPCLADWRAGRGVYRTNGAVLGITRRSRPEREDPDLFVFGLPAAFKGYYPGYSTELERDRRLFTWAILKAHTRNTAGRVTLRSADPRDPPDIRFHYFEEGSDQAGEDLDSLAVGVGFARHLMEHAGDEVVREVWPGPGVATPEQVRQFVRDEAWGHHASCTCKIGPASDPLAVVGGDFKVHGARGLRVVDASVFPRIPGFFIATSVYMVSEKAADVILAEASR